MGRRLARGTYAVLLGVAFLGAWGREAWADPLYTVTNLGTSSISLLTANGNALEIDSTLAAAGGGNGFLTSSANGEGFVAVTNGQTTYPFTVTPTPVLTPGQGILANFPLGYGVPHEGGGPGQDNFSYIVHPIMNANGLAAAIDIVSGVGHSFSDLVYISQRNADGSWGPPQIIWSSGTTLYDSLLLGSGDVRTIGITNSNQILLGTTAWTSARRPDALLYDNNTHSLTDLLSLSPLSGKYYGLTPIAIDDRGRILLWTSALASNEEPRYLLLTPQGVPLDPINVPEPSSLAVMALAMAGFALRAAGFRAGSSPTPA
jgi:hypothetical protein